MKEQVICSWSSGKDSALSLFEIFKSDNYEICTLLTTVTEDYKRVSIHGLRIDLLEQQSESLGIPLEIVKIPKNCSNEIYETQLRKTLLKYKERGIKKVVFGDIFLEDVRNYRETFLSDLNMTAIFPIWKVDSNQLAKQFIEHGFRSRIICVDSEFLDNEFLGMDFNYDFLNKLPESIDKCGENGEFHTFTYNGPVFKDEIRHSIGSTEYRDNRFWYCDIIPD